MQSTAQYTTHATYAISIQKQWQADKQFCNVKWKVPDHRPQSNASYLRAGAQCAGVASCCLPISFALLTPIESENKRFVVGLLHNAHRTHISIIGIYTWCQNAKRTRSNGDRSANQICQRHTHITMESNCNFSDSVYFLILVTKFRGFGFFLAMPMVILRKCTQCIIVQCNCNTRGNFTSFHSSIHPFAIAR